MLDLADFISERGGDLKKIKESQRKRFASEDVADEVVTLYEEARRGMSLNGSLLSLFNGWTNMFLCSTLRNQPNRVSTQRPPQGNWKEKEG